MGWYPDPADPTQDRYWDGGTWTHNVRPRPEQPHHARQHRTLGQHRPVGAASSQQGSGSNQSEGVHNYQAGDSIPRYAPNVPQPIVKTTSAGKPLASVGQRAVGWFMDYLVVRLLTFLVSQPFADDITRGTQDLMDALIRAVQTGDVAPGVFANFPWQSYLTVIGLSLLATLLYFMIMYRFASASLGQLMMGLRIVTESGDGTQLSWSTAIVRSLTRSVFAQIGILNIIDMMWPLWDDKVQTLHDKVARTQVITTRAN